MKYRLAYIVIWLLFVQNRASSQLTGETLDQYFACYGITHESVMKPSCSRTGDLIAPREVYVGAKQNSSGCPIISTDSSTTQTCCTYNADDCTGTYRNINTPSNTYSYHSDCIGLHDCSSRGRGAATMDSLYLSCPSGKFYLSQSNYMYMEYYCIPETRIGTFPSAAIEATDSIVYLKGQTYPNPITETSSGCSVEAVNCTSNIDVYFIDMRLANDTNGCTQHFNLSETSFDCSNNNDFTIQTPYRSSSNYLIVNFTATVINTGYFWLGFKSTSSSSDIIKLNCPAVQPQHQCPTTTTEASTTTEVSTTKEEMTTTDEITTENFITTDTPSTNSTATSTGMSTHVVNNDSSGMNFSVTIRIVIGVIGAVAIVAFAVIAFIVYKKKKANVCCKINKEKNHESNLENGESNLIENTLYRLPPVSNIPPISVTMNNTDKKKRKRKKKKNKKREITHAKENFANEGNSVEELGNAVNINTLHLDRDRHLQSSSGLMEEQRPSSFSQLTNANHEQSVEQYDDRKVKKKKKKKHKRNRIDAITIEND